MFPCMNDQALLRRFAQTTNPRKNCTEEFIKILAREIPCVAKSAKLGRVCRVVSLAKG